MKLYFVQNNEEKWGSKECLTLKQFLHIKLHRIRLLNGLDFFFNLFIFGGIGKFRTLNTRFWPDGKKQQQQKNKTTYIEKLLRNHEVLSLFNV